MKIVAVANLKGGVGKTSVAQSLLHAAAARGQKALGIDLDSQGNLTQQLTARNADDWFELTIADVMDPSMSTPIASAIVSTRRANIDLVPSGLDDYVAVEMSLTGAMMRELTLRKALSQLPDDAYDLVVIDCPAALGLTLTNAFAAVHSVIIVTDPSSAGFVGVGRIVNTIDTANDQLGQVIGREIEIGGIVINGHRTGVKTEEAFVVEIENYARDAEIPVLGRPVPLLAFIQRANAAGYGFDELTEIRAVEVARFFDDMLTTITGKD
ncbi:ParA family protein [Rhodococcus sp. IEGM 1408]|uniref:ParA family protein n=1 Tax=Rhodococcus sp. IEGM 1408 TaxID=3082220 RepID=UPI0029530A91|nr:AAA family ATPase [Rhodococcus sp. IEGM 1408]MDV8002864.1 AAA family ATPase [Rhodococcus sp. IEGM 1408]